MRGKAFEPGIAVTGIGSSLAALGGESEIGLLRRAVLHDFLQHGIEFGDRLFRYHLRARLAVIVRTRVNDLAIGLPHFEDCIGIGQPAA